MAVFDNQAIVMIFVTTALMTTSVCANGSSDGMPIADFCNGSMIPFNTFSVLPGNNVTITCSLPDTSVTWKSSSFSVTPVTLTPSEITTDTRLNGAIYFNMTGAEINPKCVTTTATIVNISESMQGLDLTCVSALKTISSTLNIDVIDPPPPVTASVSNCSGITVSWSNLSSVSASPITGYSVTVNSSNKGMYTVAVIATDLSCSIENAECGEVFAFTVTAESAAGSSQPSNSVTGQRICCPNDVGVIGIWDTQNYFFRVEWDDCDRSEVTGFIVNVTGPNIPSELPTVEATPAMIAVGGFDGMYSITVFSVNAAMEVCNSKTESVDVSGDFTDYKIVSDSNAANISFSYSGITISSIVTNDTDKCSTDYNSTYVLVNCTQLTPGQTFSFIITINTSEGMQYLVMTDAFIEPSPPKPSSPTSSGFPLTKIVWILSVTALVLLVVAVILIVLTCIMIKYEEELQKRFPKVWITMMFLSVFTVIPIIVSKYIKNKKKPLKNIDFPVVNVGITKLKDYSMLILLSP